MPVFRWLCIVLLLLPLSAQASRDNVDPLEPINRPLFAFNDRLDRWVLRPVASGYDAVLPQPAQNSIGSFLSNLVDINYTVNALLQGKLECALSNAGRVAVNSTLGFLGLFDVATSLGITRHRADFGQTMATWGVPEGPYLVVPLFGPRTLRSGVGNVVDIYTSVPAYMDNIAVRNSLFSLGIVHDRARLLEADELVSGDRYIFIRDAYLQTRRALVEGPAIDDTFSDFEDDWGEEF
jgi:phospholipid-binding lipoprotein MlaA